jgi:cytochrome b6-f complex iron-sulfur subunit
VSEDTSRREFLKRAWQTGLALIGAAGAWTSWDVLRSDPASGLGGIVSALPETEVTEIPVYIQSAQTYLTRIDDQIVGLWQRCPHLGCRISWCESSREFECPCHGSRFNRAGEVRSGPAPRGMDRFQVSVDGDLVEVDTGTVIQGSPPGEESIDEPPQGPSCSEPSDE